MNYQKIHTGAVYDTTEGRVKVLRKLPSVKYGRARYRVELEDGGTTELLSPSFLEAANGKHTVDAEIATNTAEVTKDQAIATAQAAVAAYEPGRKRTKSQFHITFNGIRISFEDDKRIVIERD